MTLLKNLSLFSIVVFSLFLTSCVSVPTSLSPMEPLDQLCRSAGIDFSYDPVTRSVYLAKDGQRVNLLVGSAVVVVGSERVLLNAPVTLKGKDIFVSSDFREKVIYRLDKSLAVGRLKKGHIKIMIDPGHGGKDPGATGNGIQEKDIVLDISKRLERLLRSKGFDVKMTRVTDVFLSLEERTERATEWSPDLFISIHANSSENHRVYGFEVWAPRVLTREDFADVQRRKNTRALFRQLKMKQNDKTLENTVEDMVYQYKSNRSAVLAEGISKGCSRAIAMNNRGVKESGFFVLRNTLIPSVLVEVGFISNAREAARLKDSSFRQEMAEMLANAVQEYCRGF